MTIAALCGLMMLTLATPALAQEGTICPEGEVDVLLEDGSYACVPPDVDDQTPEQIEAVTNDPRSNAETPIVENQPVDGISNSPEAQQYAPSNLTGTGQYLVGADDGVCVGEGEGDPDCAQALLEGLQQAQSPLLEDTPAVEEAPVAEAPAAANPVVETEGVGAGLASGDLPHSGGLPLLPLALLLGAGILGVAASRR